MASSREQKKAKEVVYESFRAPCLIRKLFLLCPSYSSLNGILVESPKNLLQAGSDVEFMKAVRMTRLQTALYISKLRERAELDVLVSFHFPFSSQPVREFTAVNNVIQEEVTMVCKWQ